MTSNDPIRRIARSSYRVSALQWLSLVALFYAANTEGAAGDLYATTGIRTTGDLNLIYHYDSKGNKTVFASAKTQLYGLAFDHLGNAFVSTALHGTIEKYSLDGSHVTFASAIGRPTGIAIDSSDRVFVADVQDNVIYQFDSNGNKSTYASGLNKPSALAFDESGNLFCSEVGSGRVLRISSSGASTVIAEGLSEPQALVFDRAGNLFVIEGADKHIFKITPDGARTLFAAVDYRGLGLALDWKGNLAAADNPIGYITTFDSAGRGIWIDTEVQSPIHLAIEPATSVSSNISTRLRVRSGENVLIAGFIVTGTAEKKVIIRAIGPSLARFGIAEPLGDPTLELYDQKGSLVAANDNWRDNNETEIKGTGIAPSDDHESALLAVLQPGAYTAVERGKGSGEGIGVVEVYDLNATPTSNLANISTRGFVNTGSDVMIAGFIIGAGNGSRVLIRGLGPSLATAGIANPLSNPFLELRNGNGALIQSNENWKEAQQQEIQAASLQPSNDSESALAATLATGNYTAILSGVNGTTGVGLVEVYNIK